MSEELYTQSGTRIYISKLPVTAKLEVAPADFASVQWQEIEGLYNVGELGAEQAVNEFELINSDWMLKSKGTRNGGSMTNQFIPLALDPGQIIVQQAIDDNCKKYAIKVERGADCAAESDVTITLGTPAVINWAGHGLKAGQPIIFSVDGGALPTELVVGQTYYVVAPAADSFSVAASPAGTAIATTTAGTGTITVTAAPAGMTDMFQALVLDGARSGGGKNDLYLRTYTFAVNGRIITI